MEGTVCARTLLCELQTKVEGRQICRKISLCYDLVQPADRKWWVALASSSPETKP